MDAHHEHKFQFHKGTIRTSDKKYFDGWFSISIP